MPDNATKQRRGRPKGSLNKADPKVFVTAVERALEKGSPDDSLVNMVCRQMKAGNTPLILRILEMRFGKPAQTLEHTGKDGEKLAIEITHIGAAQDKATA